MKAIRLIEVDLIRQTNSNDGCWLACCHMLIKYLLKPFSNESLRNKAGSRPDQADILGLINKLDTLDNPNRQQVYEEILIKKFDLNDEFIGEFLGIYGLNDVNIGFTEGNVYIDPYIENYINSGKPLIAGLPTEHAVLITGYDLNRNVYFVNDPLGIITDIPFTSYISYYYYT